MASLKIKMTDKLIPYERQRIHEALTKTKKEHTVNVRTIDSTQRFNFSEPILKTTTLGLIKISVYHSVFNVNKGNKQFLYASVDLIYGFLPLRSLAN